MCSDAGSFDVLVEALSDVDDDDNGSLDIATTALPHGDDCDDDADDVEEMDERLRVSSQLLQAVACQGWDSHTRLLFIRIVGQANRIAFAFAKASLHGSQD